MVVGIKKKNNITLDNINEKVYHRSMKISNTKDKAGRRPNMKRKREIKTLRKKGLSFSDIGRILGISRQSVRYHVLNPFDKLST